MQYLPLLTLAPLMMLILSDFRTRRVSVLWLCVLTIGTIGIPLVLDGWREVLWRSWTNLLLLVFLGTGITMWGWVKARQIASPVNRYIGLGDVLFFVTLVPMFPLREYLWMTMGCLVFSLVWWSAALIRHRNNPPRNIPFIATSGIVVAATIIYNTFFR
jgi:uncharacterized membrane protein YoaK (UPF0700 family)